MPKKTTTMLPNSNTLRESHAHGAWELYEVISDKATAVFNFLHALYTHESPAAIDAYKKYTYDFEDIFYSHTSRKDIVIKAQQGQKLGSNGLFTIHVLIPFKELPKELQRAGHGGKATPVLQQGILLSIYLVEGADDEELTMGRAGGWLYAKSSYSGVLMVYVRIPSLLKSTTSYLGHLNNAIRHECNHISDAVARELAAPEFNPLQVNRSKPPISSIRPYPGINELRDSLLKRNFSSEEVRELIYLFSPEEIHAYTAGASEPLLHYFTSHRRHFDTVESLMVYLNRHDNAALKRQAFRGISNNISYVSGLLRNHLDESDPLYIKYRSLYANRSYKHLSDLLHERELNQPVSGKDRLAAALFKGTF